MLNDRTTRNPEAVIARRIAPKQSRVFGDCFASLAMTAKSWSLGDLGSHALKHVKAAANSGHLENPKTWRRLPASAQRLEAAATLCRHMARRSHPFFLSRYPNPYSLFVRHCSKTLAEKPRRPTRLAMEHECRRRSRFAPMCLTCRKSTFSARV